MFTPDDSIQSPGCLLRPDVRAAGPDRLPRFGCRPRTADPSTGAAALPRRRSTRWSSITLRPSSHWPPRRIPWGTASPHGSSEISEPTCVAVFWRTASLALAAPAVATTFWSRSVARAAVCVRPVTPAAWSRPPPILSIMSCRRYPCANGCSRCRNASGPSCTTTPRSPAPCCTSSYAPFGPRSDRRVREPVPVPTSARFRSFIVSAHR